ncbi:MAG TPA: cytochrome c oxidase subunit 3 [Usitatibacter sp.]|nr:cytochrome c oxidase subunit 3 [Usitatibacter sp.]
MSDKPVFPPDRLDTQGAVAGETLDVAQLPSYVFGARGIMWWGTMGVVAIEGTVFAMAIATYFYLRTNGDTWPMGVPAPDLRWGVLNTLIMLASLLPNHWTLHRAKAHDLGRVRGGMLVCLVMGAAFILVRVFEFRTLNVSWDSNAYGSIVWMLLGLHTVHLLTDFGDTLVLYVLMLTGPLEGRRFVDVAENAEYWDFVVLAWLPVFATIYIAPRF